MNEATKFDPSNIFKKYDIKPNVSLMVALDKNAEDHQNLLDSSY